MPRKPRKKPAEQVSLSESDGIIEVEHVEVERDPTFVGAVKQLFEEAENEVDLVTLGRRLSREELHPDDRVELQTHYREELRLIRLWGTGEHYEHW
jgi:hypothetical protein